MPDPKSGTQFAEKKVTLKKKHPCGSNEFIVIQSGPEVVLKCVKCGSFIRIGKERFQRSIK